MQQRSNLHREIDRLFNDFSRGFGAPAPLAGPGEQFGLMPDMDVHEADGRIMLTMELPGVAEKDVDITFNDNLLTISGEKRSETENRNGNAYRSERSFGSFSRSMSLPFRIEPDKVEARFENGLLKVTVPRPADAGPQTKRIEIRH
ncbi:heat-shock protein Hsp20 [Youhaiella tibetensis]|uniref:Hsp20/alpha crystallin family protein n=1 Tax=Paradevosia tibetensis TaxID=1447062 RepID=A0A5B9DTU3_9HYPH|nr:Hsp20/alpha crystallin family protein [Youhaiella tibetensis]QEE22179.1 Hsp20/alpha crystallin family protein [Youhaiella tibetensis]GGF44606.1 heat-shock protein Hsp20 [Youhaiella tibetensis]